MNPLFEKQSFALNGFQFFATSKTNGSFATNKTNFSYLEA